MKLHKLYFSFLFLLVTTIFYAQNGIAYQAVIFKPGAKTLPGVSASSTPLVNTKVCLRFTFNDISDKSEYQETITVTTDDYGIVNTTIGLGNQIGGYAKNFSDVAWRTEQKTLVVELDLTANCSTYEEISRQSFSSTPYAFTANNISGIASIANGGTGASTAAEALDNLGAQRVSNLSTDINGDGASIVKYPAVKTVKEYVDNELKNVVVNATPDATDVSKGKIQLAGDLSGTAASPTVPGLALKENGANKSQNIAVDGTSELKFPSVKAVKNYIDNQVTTASDPLVKTGNVITISPATATVNGYLTKEDFNTFSNKIASSEKAANNGVATLGNDGRIPSNQIPSISFQSANVVTSESDMLAISGAQVGSIAIRTDVNKNYVLSTLPASIFGNWLELSSPTAVTSVNGNSGPNVSLTKTDINLENVENTKDIDKPISTLTQTALNLKAPLDSPAFTGTPLAPTAAVNDNSTKLATTAFVTTAVASAVGTATATPDATTTVLGKIQLSGDLSGTATDPEIGLNKVTFSKMQKVDTNTLLGRSSSGNGEIESLTTLPASTLPALTGDITTTVGSVATTIANQAVGLGKIKDLSGSSKLLGTLSTGVAVSEITLGTGLTMTDGTLNATGGTVTSVTGTANRISVTNGGTTPVVDIASGYVGQTSITTLGTITTGTWNGTAIDVAHGGTGASTLTGYVKGAGTTAMTASANIPVEDVTGAQTVDNLSTDFIADGASILKYPAVKTVKDYVDTKIAAVQAGGVSAADSTIKGIIKLGGDLAGTNSSADAPIISDLAVTTSKLADNAVTSAKIDDGTIVTADLASDAVTSVKIATGTIIAEDIADGVITTNKISGAIAIANGGTGAITVSGALTNLGAEAAANKATATDMGGSNADNTNYPTQLAVKTFVTDKFNEAAGTKIQGALNLKEDKTNKSTLTTLGTSDELYPSQKAVKTYVDNNLSKVNAISSLTSLPSIDNNTILGNISGGTSTPQAISITGTGDVVMKTNALIDNPTITSPALNGTISGTAIVPIAQGGSGVDMSAKQGYLLQATTGENFSTVSSIPVSDVAGAVQSVNGIAPDKTTGNVVVAIGNVATGISSTLPTLMGTKPLVASDIYIIAGQSGTVNDNGRTYIYDGAKWQEITSNLASTDNRYVQLSGNEMKGNLSFPTGNKIIINDGPTGDTDVANKKYVDAKILAATPDATTTVLGKIQLSGDLSGTATDPEIGLNKVTFSKMQKVDTNTLLGRSSSGNGGIESLTTLPASTLPALTGDITTTVGSVATTIANQAVGLGKIKDLSGSSKLLGTLSTGVAVSEITLGTGLTMTDGILNATGGTVTSVTGTANRISVTNGTTTPVVDIASGYVGQSSITTLGTITTGTWNGTAIDVAHGGTGASTLTGYVKGAGTTAMTASANIPVSDVTGAQTVNNLSTDFIADGASILKYPAVKTVKDYVDTSVSSGVTSINTDIITGNYNVLTTDYTLLCDASTGFTLTLPAANAVKGKVYIIRKIDETENALTFSPEIAVSTTTNISNLNYSKTIRVQSNGTKWYLID